jgi:hypothetical protein
MLLGGSNIGIPVLQLRLFLMQVIERSYKKGDKFERIR